MNQTYLAGIACPKCGHEDRFFIEVAATAIVVDEGVEKTDSENDWSEDSRIECGSCRHTGKVRDFVPVGFYVSFSTTTPESAENGEHARCGWWETGFHLIEDVHDKPNYPAFLFDFDPDEHDDISDAKVEWAVSTLRNEGATYFSGIDWWDTEGNEVLDYATGETIRLSFHPQGFTAEELERIVKDVGDDR